MLQSICQDREYPQCREGRVCDPSYDVHQLEDAFMQADVFIGLSIANIVTPEMLLSMADNPIVFAMANPDPEIEYGLACATRDDVLMATGRSDHPNQVNNVPDFRLFFRGRSMYAQPGSTKQ